MTRRNALPPGLGDSFATSLAQRQGVSPNRLRAGDLEAPFVGIRKRRGTRCETDDHDSPYLAQAAQRRNRARDYAPRLVPGQFYSHETAAAWYHAPLPLVLDENGDIADLSEGNVHVTAFGTKSLPRLDGVRGHRDRNRLSLVRTVDGVAVSSPASTWASLGQQLLLPDLVALGDFFCRQWRDGVGRRDAGRPPLATLDELHTAAQAGRRVGVVKLRQSLELIREDSWSPRESALRVLMWQWGLPDPELNLDVFTDTGAFLGCVDLAYPDQKIAIEYHGQLHGAQYAKDVERMAALRAAGWIVIEVTSETLRRPETLIPRIRAALSSRR